MLVELHLEGGGFALQLLGVVIFGEGDVDVELIADVVADDLLLKAGDELAGADGQAEVLALAAVKRHAVQEAFESRC